MKRVRFLSLFMLFCQIHLNTNAQMCSTCTTNSPLPITVDNGSSGTATPIYIGKGANREDNSTAMGLQALSNSTNPGALRNSAFGSQAMKSFITGDRNCAFGFQALFGGTNAAGDFNSAFGTQALFSLINGNQNVAIGSFPLSSLRSGSNNIGIGNQVMYQAMYTSNNIGIGNSTLFSLTTGTGNTAMGVNSLAGLTTGSNNVGIGINSTVSSATSDNQLSIQNVIYGINMASNLSSAVGIGIIPAGTEKLEINGKLKIYTIPTATPNGTYLFSNNGVVSQATLPGAGCNLGNYIPVSTGSSGSLSCSQIYDNGSTIGINSTGPFSFTYPGGIWYEGVVLPPTSGTLKLDVNGVTRALAYYATSDEKFKTNIKTIKNALELISSIRGVTYDWKEKSLNGKEFNNLPQIGFIAQELEKVVPQAVLIDENGDYSVNYSSIIPILSEGIKQQEKIIEQQQEALTKLDNRIIELESKIKSLSNLINEKFDDSNSKLTNALEYFEINPNPSNGYTRVTYSLPKNSQQIAFSMLDDNGRIIKNYNVRSNLENGSFQLDTAGLSNGIYNLSLFIKGRCMQTKRIFVQH